jgi:signal transduction histidine kinase
MTDALLDEEVAAGSRWWISALSAATLVCIGTAAVQLTRPGTPWEPIALTALAMLAYLLFFLLVARRAVVGSALAWVSVGVTIVAAGTFTAILPSNAVVQFWVYPLLWVLIGSVKASVIASFFAAAAVFVGFGVGAGWSGGWLLSAAITQLISYGVNLVLGLWITRVYEYAQERARLLAELTAAQDELAALHREAGVTAEREHLSRELHDTIAQSLAGTVLLAQRTRREFAAEKLDDATLALVEDAARTALAETRALVAGLAPVELRGGGIAEALGQIADRFTRETDLPVAVSSSPCAGLEREAEVALLRCAQEALANVRRHAAASRVRLELTCDEDAACLRVLDDGHGFDPQAASTGFGLAGLRSRLALVGGTVEIDGTPGATAVLARVPRTGGTE